MATGKGVIQGYTGVAAVDRTHQIIVEAQAHGTGSEQELLIPMVTAVHELLGADTLITADAGYHSEANLQALAAMPVTALIADGALRRRDERVATQERHQQAPDPLHDKTRMEPTASLFQPSDFTYDAEARTCVCPAGKSLYRKGRNLVTNGFVAEHFRGAKRDGAPCVLRAQCVRTPEETVDPTSARRHGATTRRGADRTTPEAGRRAHDRPRTAPSVVAQRAEPRHTSTPPIETPIARPVLAVAGIMTKNVTNRIVLHRPVRRTT